MKKYFNEKIINLANEKSNAERDEQLEFMAGIDKMWMDKNPKVQFALHTTSDRVKEAYNKMLHDHGSDYRDNTNG